MIVLIDNYDSFTYNIVQAFQALGETVVAHQNDKVSIDELAREKPKAIILSPGPGRPEDAGVSMEVVQKLGKTIPLLGVCLGHQCIAQAFGSEITSAHELIHGRVVGIENNTQGLFQGLPNHFKVTRYNSLVVDPKTVPACLEQTAWVELGSEERELMALRHREYPIHSVQFHPESILSEYGVELFENFLKICGDER